MARIGGSGRATEIYAGGGRFRPLECIGHGSMGTVYRAYDADLGTVVALKALRTTAAEELYRLKTEFRLLAGIAHHNLVQLHELIVDGNGCFFTMEYVPGIDFVRHVRRPSAADGAAARLARLLAAAPQLAQGLAALHAAQRLHRDVKPANVLVAHTGRVVLLDFGLAAICGERGWADSSRGLAGTIAYMAPEQAWGGTVGPAADLYALGVVLYEALTGRLPFVGDPAQVLHQKATYAAPDPRDAAPDTPAWLAALVGALLAADAAARPAMPAVLAALQAAPQRARSAATDGAAPELIGRLRETALLVPIVAARRAGAAVVRISGPSGIGKSALLRHVVGPLQDRDDALVLAGRCLEQESVPFKAFDAIVDQASRFLRGLGDGAAGYLPRHADALLRLFPVLGRVPVFADVRRAAPSSDSREERRLAFGALRELFARLGDARRLVLCIDDAHWADLDSAALLGSLLRPPDPPPLTLLIGERGDTPTALLAALDELIRQPGAPPVTHLHLEPLAAADAAELASRVCSGGLDAATSATLVREAAGSPFLVVELARAMRRGADSGAPRSLDIAALLDDRLAALTPSARALAELVALAGAPLDRRVLLRAAQVGEAGRPLVVMLEQEGLVRTLAVGDHLAVEPYHDRIRDGVVAAVPASRRVSRHLELATALEAGSGEPDQLARHFHAAGRLAHAAGYAEQAAERAAAQFAFARAAALYRQAREWDPRDAGRTHLLLVREAAVLANAGQLVDASQTCLTASRAAARMEAFDLRRQACEHLIAAGSIDDGLVELAALLRDLGLPFPPSTARALAGVAGRLLLLRLRPLARWRPSGPAGAEDLLRIDTLYAAGKSLVDADAVRGVYFSMMALRRALRSGDAERVGRSACVVGGALVAAGGPLFAGLGRRLLAMAVRLAQDDGSAALRGTVLIGCGQVHMLEGRWRDALDYSQRGIVALERLGGCVFERHIGQGDMLRSLTEVGDLRGLGELAGQLIEIAVGTRNTRSELYALCPLARVQLARDDRAGARALLERAERLLPRGFHLQHLYVLRMQLVYDLYVGDATAGLAKLDAAWALLRDARLLRISLSRVDTYAMRARLALAVAAGDPARRGRLFALARRDARRLASEGRPDAAPHADQIAGTVAALRGDVSRAVAALEAAVRGYDKAGMSFDAAATRVRLGELRGDTAAAAPRDALAWLRDAGVADPERWVAIHAAPVTIGTNCR